MKEPKIRFKGFQGEWVEKALKEVAPLQRGFDLPSHSICTGLIPIAYSNGVLNYHNIGKCYAPGLVTGRSGTIGKFTFIESGMYWPHNTSLWVTNFFNNVPKYIYYMYHTIGIEKYSTGSGVPTLNRNDVHDIIIYCPSIAEQQSIADYFTNLDTLIQSTTKKIESLKQVKAASLQSMFPQEGETTPRVRFKGFEGEWEKVKLGDICEKVVRKAKPDTKAPVMMISAANGFVNQSEKYASDNAGKSLDNYTLILKGELCYNHGYSKIRNFGSCFCLQLLEARVPFVYHSFKPYNDDSVYLAIYLNSGIIDGELKKRVSSTARMDGLLNISYDSYMTTLIKIPSYAEQRAIASYFSTLDRQITLQTQRLKKLKQIKAACLDNMFV